MSEYINRDDLIKNLKTFAPEHYTPLIDSLIQKQPAADVRPAVRAKWVMKFSNGVRHLECSNCHKEPLFSMVDDLSFCPYCGRDMRGD